MKKSILTLLFISSLFAEYKMIDTKNGTLMYDTKTGQVWEYDKKTKSFHKRSYLSISYEGREVHTDMPNNKY